MDIYQLLKEDHRKVKAIFEELEETTERSVKKREILFANLKMELTVHADAEETQFYSRLMKPKEMRDITTEALQEHELARDLLSQLNTDPKDTEEWTAKLTVLKENVEHHIEEEEGTLFRKARTILSEKEAIAIAEEVETFKEGASAINE